MSEEKKEGEMQQYKQVFADPPISKDGEDALKVDNIEI